MTGDVAAPRDLKAPAPVEGRKRVISPLLAAAAMLLLALNLRLGISSIGPVLPQILHDLGATVVFGSLLTTVPVVMMGLASPLSGRLADRFGVEWTVIAALLVIGVATFVRLWAVTQWLLVLSALVLGIGIAAGNTMLPAIVRRYFPVHVALMTGLYTAGINVGAAGAALVTPQLTRGRRPHLARSAGDLGHRRGRGCARLAGVRATVRTAQAAITRTGHTEERPRMVGRPLLRPPVDGVLRRAGLARPPV